MSEREPSKTALAVAALRAAHQFLDGTPKILDDPITAQLLGPAVVAHVREHPERYETRRARALRAHVLLRSRYAEDRLAEAAARGVAQYLILGAGLDTFAYRQPAWAGVLRIFEVDQPASQREKRQRVQAAGITPPGNLEYVPIDFESTSIDAGLRDSGFDPSCPTFVSWLGVMVYLSREAAEAVFQFAAALPKSSEIVFTFSAPVDESSERRGLPSLAERAAELGEPWQTRIAADELARHLRDLGFANVTIPTVDELEARYMAERTDGLHAGRRQTIASARV